MAGYSDSGGYDYETPYDYESEVGLDPWGRPPGDPNYGQPPITPPAAAAPTPTPAQPDPETAPEPDPTQPPPPPPAPGGGGTPNTGGLELPVFQAPNLPNIAPFQSALNPYEYTPFAEPGGFDESPYVFDNSPYEVAPFQAPTLEQAQSEPGYEMARTDGLRALMNANLGNLKNGGTLKHLIGWGNRFAEQNYGNVYNRAANTYGINRDTVGFNRNNAFEALQANRGNAFQTHQTNRNNLFQTHNVNELGKLNAFNTNFGAEKDVWDRNSGLQLDLYDRDLQGRKAEFDPRMQSYLAQLAALTQLANGGV